ncbi:hypothetical protein BR311_003666 [Escherichia coli]|nr:hypothetical protein [Escherichia coli]
MESQNRKVDNMNIQRSKIKKERKEKCINTNIILLILTLACILWVFYFSFGGALGWVWNPINIFAIPYFGLHGTVQEAWGNLSLSNTFSDNSIAFISLVVIAALIGVQIVMLSLAITEVQNRWLKDFVFWLTNDRVIMRYFGFRMTNRININSYNESDVLNEAEENHWKKWKEYYKSDLSFDEWKRKYLKR